MFWMLIKIKLKNIANILQIYSLLSISDILVHKKFPKYGWQILLLCTSMAAQFSFYLENLEFWEENFILSAFLDIKKRTNINKKLDDVQ